MVLKNSYIIIARKTGSILLWGMSVTLVLLMIGQFYFWNGVIWLGTSAGQNYIKEFLPGAVKDIPYTLIFETQDLPENRIGIDFSAIVMDKTIKASAYISYEQDVVTLESLILQAPDIKVSGAGRYDSIKDAFDAKFSGTVKSLQNYPELVGHEHRIKPLSFDLSLKQQGKSDPVITFEASTKEYVNQPLNITARNVNLSGRYANETLSIYSLSANDHAKGTLKASGTYDLEGEKAVIQITAHELSVLRKDIASSVLSGAMDFQGDTLNGYELKGTITAQKVDITIPDNLSGSLPELNVQVQGQGGEKASAPPFVQRVKLDVRVSAPKRVIVRGRGLDAEFGGELDIKGTAAKPLYYGNLKFLRGCYNEFGKVFKFTKANLEFSGSVPPSPSLDIKAQTKAGDITAIISITGPATSPKVGFSSNPSLPEDEVLSHILFGESMESLTPFQAVQLAQTLGRLTGQGGSASNLDPVSVLRKFTGLDDLRVEMNDEGAASVGAGKYLTDNVYLEFESGTQEGSGNANVEVELTPNVTLESEVGQDASGGAGLFWKWDY